MKAMISISIFVALVFFTAIHSNKKLIGKIKIRRTIYELVTSSYESKESSTPGHDRPPTKSLLKRPRKIRSRLPPIYTITMTNPSLDLLYLAQSPPTHS